MRLPWIEHVPQSITEKIEPQNSQDDGQTSRQRNVRRGQEHELPLGEHRSPVRGRRLHPEPQKRQRRQVQQRVCDVDRRDDNDRRDAIGENVPEDDASLALAKCSRGLGVSHLFLDERDAAHNASDEWHIEDSQGQRGFRQAGSECRDDGKRQ